MSSRIAYFILTAQGAALSGCCGLTKSECCGHIQLACITQAFCIARAVLQRVVWSCLVERRRALQKAWKHPTGEGPVRPCVARAPRALSASRVHRGCVLSLSGLSASRVYLECVMISDGADGSLSHQKLPGPLDRPAPFDQTNKAVDSDGPG